jgi:hypothetical protein
MSNGDGAELKIREKIKIYSIYKEKIDKISDLEKKKQDLINKILYTIIA